MTEQPTCALNPFIDLFVKHNVDHRIVNPEQMLTSNEDAAFTAVFFDDLLNLIEPGMRDGILTVTSYPSDWSDLGNDKNKIIDVLISTMISCVIVETNPVGKTTIGLYDPKRKIRFITLTQAFTTDREVKQGDIVTLTSGHYDPKDVDVFVAARDFLMRELMAELNQEYLQIDEMHEIAIATGYLTKHKAHHAIVTSADNDFMYNGTLGHTDFYVSGVSQSTAILVPVIED